MNTEVTRRLGIRYPIIQGPFGGGFSTIKLAALVSNAGGVGSFGAQVIPPDRIEALTRDLRAQTNQPFVLNLWVSDHDPGGLELTQEEFDRVYRRFEPYFRELGVDKPQRPQRYHQNYEAQVEALLEARPPCFSFVFGIPSPTVLAECKRRGIVTIGNATSIAEGQALDEAGVDLIIATGMEAGGHRVSFLGRAEDQLMGTFALTQLIAARVKAPVIAAGGIADGRGVRAALLLGAQAAQLGTAFLACEESGTTPEHRAILLSDKAQHTVLTRAFSGRLARGVRNRWTDEVAPTLGTIAPFPVQNWFMAQLRPAAVKAGRSDLVSLWAGQIAPNLKHRTAGALMEALIADLG
jgi:nitronate monooxygenase